jgi:hypothetical protein
MCSVSVVHRAAAGGEELYTGPGKRLEVSRVPSLIRGESDEERIYGGFRWLLVRVVQPCFPTFCEDRIKIQAA